MGLFLVEVVAIIGGNQFNAQFSTEQVKAVVDFFLLGKAVFLNLELEPIAKNF